LDIECDLPLNQHLPLLESTAKERFKDRYPKFRTQFAQEHQIATSPDGPPQISVLPAGIQAFHFVQDDEKQLVQVRLQGFSFNRLAPYTSLDDYLPEIKRTWNLYTEIANPVQIRMIRLRYINRIILPFTEGKLEVDDYFKVGPQLPDEEDNLRFVGFFNQHAAVDMQTGHQVNIVLTSQEPEKGYLPIIFDNGVAAAGPGEAENWVWISGRIQSLRDLKNRIFKNTLTKQCLELFQQP